MDDIPRISGVTVNFPDYIGYRHREGGGVECGGIAGNKKRRMVFFSGTYHVSVSSRSEKEKKKHNLTYLVLLNNTYIACLHSNNMCIILYATFRGNNTKTLNASCTTASLQCIQCDFQDDIVCYFGGAPSKTEVCSFSLPWRRTMTDEFVFLKHSHT